ncbi:pyridine nucleotide transhydrogenase [Cryobacterium sp. Hh7]|uniref:pyridine nucleotide transhydrogenase n=1 Tax=Cryobacterium sp. Hh7 TaxID=1259159 RepID=UPI00106BA31A|nr:pyridine nucleotide transhydrogenase [Cryobacterium sp. Hh7]TFD51770.1 pyridine nucleotide transhydrogenase [Cryobacterium sp. Hh7]
MSSALFGFTGFVGSNLMNERHFDDLYNTRNASDSFGREYDLVVFSAAKAEKWRINQNPTLDLAHMSDLRQLIAGVTAKQFVLISTVDVYKDPVGVDERTQIITDGLHPYGLHRYQLEEFTRRQHPTALIVRLPGLFGPGLKKNIIFDLLHQNNLERIHADGSFQYYDLAHLGADLTLALTAKLRLVNLTSAPIRTADLAREAFAIDFSNRPDGASPGRYDMRTRHATVFGGEGEYTRSRDETMADLIEFVHIEQARN